MCQGVGLAFRTVTVALFHRHGGLESPCNWPFQPGICRKKVTTEILLLAMAYNINKLHAKIQNDRTGMQLFVKDSA